MGNKYGRLEKSGRLEDWKYGSIEDWKLIYP
jgi:hypothetical protein